LTEPEFIAALRSLARDPAARGLLDDAAVLGDLVFTHDMIVEGVHFLGDDPPEDIAWKLAAVNLSDLAAKGAEPVGCLLGYTLGPEAWNAAFIAGLQEVLEAHAMPLLGGDTVKANGPRSFGLTAIGRASHVPSRAGAKAGDALYVTGTRWCR
jgi:thiamine-monophosphate kinase